MKSAFCPAMVEPLEARRLLTAVYDLVDLGISSDAIGEATLDVNSIGEVLTKSNIFRYAGGGIQKVYHSPIDLPAFSSPSASKFTADERKIVGQFQFNGDEVPGAGIFFFKEQKTDVVAQIGTLDEGGISAARAANSLGQVVGFSEDSTNPDIFDHAFLGKSRRGVYHLDDINGFLPASENIVLSDAPDINEASQTLAIGKVPGSGIGMQSVLLKIVKGKAKYLLLPGLKSSSHAIQARGLNGLGQVVGGVDIDSNLNEHATLWTTSRRGVAITDLGTFGGKQSQARDINDLGQVVGYATLSSGEGHGFLYTPDKGKLDLNSITAGLGNLIINYANAINNSGYIAADAKEPDGTAHAVLLIPRAAAGAAPIQPARAATFSEREIRESDPVWE
jgi:probable HAF family extracellular repeat protein